MTDDGAERTATEGGRLNCQALRGIIRDGGDGGLPAEGGGLTTDD